MFLVLLYYYYKKNNKTNDAPQSQQSHEVFVSDSKVQPQMDRNRFKIDYCNAVLHRAPS